MISLIVIFGCSLIALQGTNSYVLLQVRKTDANHSNVDALIHKVVSSEKLEQFAERLGKQKFSEQKEDKNDDESSSSGLQIKMKDDEKAVLDFLGPSKTKSKSIKILETKNRAAKSEPDLTDIVKMAAKKIAKSKSGPVFRSKSDGYLFKPETVNLRSGQSSLYTLDSDSIAVALQDVLTSAALRAYLDKLTRKAAVVYRAVLNDYGDYRLIESLYSLL